MRSAADDLVGHTDADGAVGLMSRLDGIELVLFDKDGTLIDFDSMWGGWVRELAVHLESVTGTAVGEPLFRAMGFDPASGRTLGNAPLAVTPMPMLRELTVRVLEEIGVLPGEAEAAVARSWEPPDPVSLALPVTDLRALFITLRARGLRVAIATTDDRSATERTLDGLGVARLVDAVVCGDDGLAVKPEPAMVLHVCRTLGVDPGRTAVVGDSPADLAMARAAGAGLCVGVLSGVGGRTDLEPMADAIIASIRNLIDL